MTMILITLLRWTSDILFKSAEKDLEKSNNYSILSEYYDGTNVFWIVFYLAKFYLKAAYFWMGLGFHLSALLRWLNQLILHS